MEWAAARDAAEGMVRPRIATDAFAAALSSAAQAMILTDPQRSDNPIIFANDAFVSLTGFAREEIEGRNCRFLQGAGTDQAAARRIGKAIVAGEAISVDILNYRKDGTPFWNALNISPVRAPTGELRYYFAAASDVTERHNALDFALALVREVDHRVKNSLQMVSALMALQMGAIADPVTRETLTTMLHRIEALSNLHRRFHRSDDPSSVSLAGLVRDIVADLVGASGRTDIAVDLELEPIRIPAQQAAAVALIVNELVTNAIKHAFADGPGRIAVRACTKGRRHRIEIADNGSGIPNPLPPAESFGSSIVRMLALQLGATVTVSARLRSGTRVILDLPIAASDA